MHEPSESTYYREQLQSGEKSLPFATFLALSIVNEAMSHSHYKLLNMKLERVVPQESKGISRFINDRLQGIGRGRRYNPTENSKPLLDDLAKYEDVSDIVTDAQLIDRITKHSEEVKQLFTAIKDLMGAKAAPEAIKKIVEESKVLNEAERRHLGKAIRVYENPVLTPDELKALSLYKTLVTESMPRPDEIVKERFPDVDLNLIYGLDSYRYQIERYLQFCNWMADFTEVLQSRGKISPQTPQTNEHQFALFNVSLDGRKGVPFATPAMYSQRGWEIDEISMGFNPLFPGCEMPKGVQVESFSNSQLFGQMEHSPEELNTFLNSLSEYLGNSGRSTTVFTHVTDPMYLPKIVAEGRLWASRQSFEQTFDRPKHRTKTTGTFLETISLGSPTEGHLEKFRFRFSKGKEPLFIFDIPEGVEDRWNNYAYQMGGISISDPKLVCIWVPTETYRNNLLTWISTWDEGHVKAVFGSKNPSEVIVHNIEELSQKERELAVVKAEA